MTNEEFYTRLDKLQKRARQLSQLVLPGEGEPLCDDLDDALANAEWGVEELHLLAQRFEAATKAAQS